MGSGGRMPDIVEQARKELEVLPAEYNRWTSKLYARGDLLPLDDPRGRSAVDFVGRLRALFGQMERDEYVFRHRATGFVVTAFIDQSGASYGGAPKFPTRLPALGSSPTQAELFDAARAQAARIQADPLLSKGRAIDWDEYDLSTISAEDLTALREREHAWRRRFADVAAPPGFAEVVARLDELLNAVRL
jgi:hypothetical protein